LDKTGKNCRKWEIYRRGRAIFINHLLIALGFNSLYVLSEIGSETMLVIQSFIACIMKKWNGRL
jgi:hypothetical protein